MTAPSVTIPAGHNADRLLEIFATPNSSTITLPGELAGRWNFHAIEGFGISAAMGDAAVSSGDTGNYVALQGTSSVNIGAFGGTPASRRIGNADANPIHHTDAKSEFYTDAKPSIDTDPHTNPRAYANPNTYTHTCSDCDAYSDRNSYASRHSSAFTHFSDFRESSGWHY